jgi:hypothetical protein
VDRPRSAIRLASTNTLFRHPKLPACHSGAAFDDADALQIHQPTGQSLPLGLRFPHVTRCSMHHTPASATKRSSKKERAVQSTTRQLVIGLLLASTGVGIVASRAAAADGIAPSRAAAADGVAALIARIERPQVPDRQGFDGLSMQELMQRLHVPGVSLAVIKDFQIHWAKSYGVADTEKGGGR